MQKSYVLSFQCEDQPGIIARISSALFDNGANISESEQFEGPESGWFFMRTAFSFEATTSDVQDRLWDQLQTIANSLDATWSLRMAGERKKVLILVSKQDHCLADLLYRYRVGELNMDIVGVVSNHPLESVVTKAEINDIPYHYLPVSAKDKPHQEAQIKTLIEENGVELVILARYMQILSDEFANYLAGHCINIHHSFLPSFKGSKPYVQAHRRGVKLIGATAHYVTGDLDEGPIIAQDVKSISHRDTSTDLIRIGRDIEQRVLANAVRSHLQDRVFLKGNRTVVF